MTTRAAINILGADGTLIDVTSLGVDTITTEHPGLGQYLVHGTLGMVPPPLGWGYVLNQADADSSIAISYNEGVLAVSVAKNGEPADLAHSITLHIVVEALPPLIIPEPAPPPTANPIEEAIARLAHLRAVADYAIVPLQDAVDVDEATPEEVVSLKAWKKYRVSLSRVPEQANYPQNIDWPIAPE